ncbi:preprotein translocase subunit YajC [Mycolicibacterium arenosum]|uniref:Preprotein translocase subunit YajC n=1 Tax=Mycolicibacterium arenosum TaxID=2952157 RepID=A0ABT1M167_9MYCO|nr:preprotein translocase subunit YajC [Mycolicibacterium sp. CAU 1645]MCP9272891.1 preprotein translocase subunit YajC [Mycolicibacterium sp. CAU 1645]
MDLALFLPLLIVLGAFMFFASRKQKKAMQATIDLHESLKIGDRVHTTSGLEATITGVGDDSVDLEIAPGVVTTWMKLAVRDVIEPDDEDEADEDGDDYEYEEDVADDAYDVRLDKDPTRSPKTDS